MNLSELSSRHLLQCGGFLLETTDPDPDESCVRRWLADLGFHQGVMTHPVDLITGPHLVCQLEPCFRLQYLPLHDTLDLQTRWQRHHGQPLTLEQEIVLSLLAAPHPLFFADLQALQSHVRVRCNIVRAARKTALAFKTQAAERPASFWHYDETHGFLLQPGRDLIEAIVAATQPEATGRLYDFSCYRATEYVILLGLAQEARTHDPALYARLQQTCQEHAIRSGQFHEVFLVEYGSLEAPLPCHFYVPGDRLWFRNPDAGSSDVEGYEGSWVIYMGEGLFSNFWERERPFTLESKCLEIFHWRDGVREGTNGQLEMDEQAVAQAVQATMQNPQSHHATLERMMRFRDPQGLYAEGGCIDASREYPRGIGQGSCQLVLPQLAS